MVELFGVIHLPSLNSHSSHTLTSITEYAVSQAILLDELGYDGVIVENFGDNPFPKYEVDVDVLTKLAIICHEIKQEIGGMIGLNILRNATVQAMKLSSVLELDFVRSNIWEGAYITDQGIIEGVSHEVIDAKSLLDSNVEIYADIFVKHATPLGSFSLIEAATHALGRGGADRVIISGRSTGDPITSSDLDLLNDENIFPMVGSGLTHDSVEKYQGKISGAIVGTAIKQDDVTSPISFDKAKSLLQLWVEYM